MNKYFTAAVPEDTLVRLRLQAALEQRSLASLAGAILTAHVEATELSMPHKLGQEVSA